MTTNEKRVILETRQSLFIFIIMSSELVKDWFADRFSDLHPLLQKLHVEGGRLRGKVDLYYGSGISGILGRRLARKMKLPGPGSHELSVTISHDDEYLYWNRRFNSQHSVESLFRPVGDYEDGYWIETAGPLSLKLTVDIKNGGWHWRCLQVCLFGCPIPMWLTPSSVAYKEIKNNRYQFHVSFSLPILGVLVTYKGMLDVISEGSDGSE